MEEEWISYLLGCKLSILQQLVNYSFCFAHSTVEADFKLLCLTHELRGDNFVLRYDTNVPCNQLELDWRGKTTDCYSANETNQIALQ